MNRHVLMFSSIGLGFVLGFVFPRVYLLLWAIGFGIAFALAWPELKAGYSRRAERTVRKKPDQGSSSS